SPFCPIANATGCPAVSLPVTRSEQGLPIGMQLVAPLGRDDLLIEIAAAYEREYPWDRYSPLASYMPWALFKDRLVSWQARNTRAQSLRAMASARKWCPKACAC